MAKKNLNVGQKRFTKATGLFVTLWDDDLSKLTDTTYDIHDIVADTLSVEQAEPDTSDGVDWEFGDSQLISGNTSLGEITFTAECIDFQNDIMKTIFGYHEDTNSGAMFAPASYKDRYAFIHVTFRDPITGHSDTPDIFLPKVKLNSQIALGTLRTDVARGTFSGTAENAIVSVFPTKTASDWTSGVATDATAIEIETGTGGTDSDKTTVETPLVFLAEKKTVNEGTTTYTNYTVQVKGTDGMSGEDLGGGGN